MKALGLEKLKAKVLGQGLEQGWAPILAREKAEEWALGSEEETALV
jgi:hypothetical protein